MATTSIPVCPLMSAGNDITIVCIQEKCAWYINNLKKCPIYALGHKSMLDIKDKITNRENND